MSKKKKPWYKYIINLLFTIMGVISSIFIGGYLVTVATSGSNSVWYLVSEVLIITGILAAYFIQIIIHEISHLFLGLLTGYRFLSFRIGNLMWMIENGRLKCKILHIAGTCGQCLMIPPEISEGKIPFVLFNIGGSIINLVSGIIFFGLYLLYKQTPYISTFLCFLGTTGFVFALYNGIPMKKSIVSNDGYNVISLKKDNKALRSFWVQLKISEEITKGIRLKDMPKDWFSVPSAYEMKNNMMAAMGVFACNRLMDLHLFEDAEHLMNDLLEIDSEIVGLHRGLMICDRIYCELINENRQNQLDGMLDIKQKKFMKSMKNFLSVLRTKFSYALLAEKDEEKAIKIKAQFKKCASTYPYQGDIESELELIEIAEIQYALAT